MEYQVHFGKAYPMQLKDKQMITTDVIFRKWKDGSILALFPHCVETYEGNVMSYEHVGQHGSADYGHCIYNTKPAKEHEYKSLKDELESIGYNLNVIKRQNYNKFLLGLNGYDKDYHRIRTYKNKQDALRCLDRANNCRWVEWTDFITKESEVE